MHCGSTATPGTGHPQSSPAQQEFSVERSAHAPDSGPVFWNQSRKTQAPTFRANQAFMTSNEIRRQQRSDLRKPSHRRD